MDSCNFPRTVDEMLAQGWYDKIMRKVRKYNLNDILNTPEELVQDVFVQIIKSDYLARYDPDYRPFEVYIYTLVENLIKKRGIRENTEGGKKIVNHASLENTLLGEKPEPNTVYLDMLDIDVSDESPEDRIYMEQLIEATKESLKDFKAHSNVEVDGELIERDPITVFKFILAGKSVSEIADVMQTSKQFIYVLLKKIRGVESMQEFYGHMLSSNRIVGKGLAENV